MRAASSIVRRSDFHSASGLRGCKLSVGGSFQTDAKTHWEKVYTTKEPETVSWYRAHLETSVALVERAAHSRSASIIDIGAGESTLVDDLLSKGS
jgi:hypothetical protein